MKRFFVFLLCLASVLSWGQIPPSTGLTASQLPGNQYVIPGYTGEVANVTTHKAKTLQGELLWNAPTKFTFVTTKSATWTAGEVVTGSVSGATANLVWDTGSGTTSGILILRPNTATPFVAADNLTGATSGSTATVATQFQQSVNYVVSPYKSNTGIILYNGQQAKLGAATVMPSYAFGVSIYGTGSGLYLCSPNTNSTYTYAAHAGTLTLGESVSQSGTLTVNGATNASPIVVSTTASHGLVTGSKVTIASATGNTAANGTFTITNVDATHFSLNGSTGNGAWVSGGTVTYGATGWLWANSGTVLSIELTTTSGYFDATHTITGATSTATASTPSASSNTTGVWFIEWSPDGQEVPFKPVLATHSSSIYLAHQICDCGIITKSITVASGTYSNTRVLVFGDYGDNTSTTGPIQFYFNLPDKEPFVWHKAFACRGTAGQTNFGSGGDQAIRHFHGEEFFPGFGANDGRLLVMTGDNDYQPSILYCDDVADLCNNPSNWGQYWGLTNVNGPARSSWFSSTTIYQQTLTYSSESGAFRTGEKVTQGANIAYVVADDGSNTLTINLDPGSSAFVITTTVTGATSNSTCSPSGVSSTTNMGGGKNYVLGVNPYPLGSTASVTGSQCMGGQDSRTVELVGDGINVVTATWTGTWWPNDVVRQNTSGAWGTLLSTAANTLYIWPDPASPPFDNTHSIVGADSYITATVSALRVNRYLYFIPDQAARYTYVGTLPPNDGYALPNGGNVLRRIDLFNKTVQTMSGRVHGEGFQGCLTPDGTILFESESDFNGGTWAGNADAYIHMYAVTPDGTNLQEVSKWLRADSANPSGAVFFARCFWAFGAVWSWDINSTVVGGDSIIAFNNKPMRQYDQYSFNTITQPAPPALNLLPDSKFGRSETNNEWKSAGSVGSAGVVPVSTITGLIPNYDAGMSTTAPNYIYKLIPSGSTGICNATYTLSVLDMYPLRGSFVTASGWTYIPKVSTNAPGLQLQDGNGTQALTLINPTDGWQRVSSTIYIAPTDQSLLFQLYARTSLSATDTTFSAWYDLELTPGTQPSPSGTLGQEAYHNEHDTQRLSTSITYASANVTATYLQARYRNITFTGTTAGARTFILPTVSANQGTNTSWWWSFTNSTADIITVNINGSTGVPIAAGKSAIIKINAAGTDTLRVTPDT